MEIHVVQPGDTLFRLSRQYNLPMERLIQDNQLPNPAQLVVGQALVLRFPALTHVVREGDTLYALSQRYQVSPLQLLRNNPVLKGRDQLVPGQSLVIRYRYEPLGALTVNGYAYPSIDPELLTATLPFLSQLTPFTYRFTPTGALISLQDEELLKAAIPAGVTPVFHLSSVTEEGQFSGELAHQLLSNPVARGRLVSAILNTVSLRGYWGVDVDFEFLYDSDASLYPQFLGQLHQALAAQGAPLTVALAPKISHDQPGRLYEGLDFSLIAREVDCALLMTYDWGWPGGPPMAVSPLPQVRQAAEYALIHFSPQQLMLGIPNYGYDWPLPYREGNRAVSVNNVQAVRLAWDRHAAIRFDQVAQAPWFPYVDGEGREHQVWFEDPRSIRAKVELALELGLRGVSYWNLDRPFPQNWVALNALAEILPEEG